MYEEFFKLGMLSVMEKWADNTTNSVPKVQATTNSAPSVVSSTATNAPVSSVGSSTNTPPAVVSPPASSGTNTTNTASSIPPVKPAAPTYPNGYNPKSIIPNNNFGSKNLKLENAGGTEDGRRFQEMLQRARDKQNGISYTPSPNNRQWVEEGNGHWWLPEFATDYYAKDQINKQFQNSDLRTLTSYDPSKNADRDQVYRNPELRAYAAEKAKQYVPQAIARAPLEQLMEANSRKPGDQLSNYITQHIGKDDKAYGAINDAVHKTTFNTFGVDRDLTSKVDFTNFFDSGNLANLWSQHWPKLMAGGGLLALIASALKGGGNTTIHNNLPQQTPQFQFPQQQQSSGYGMPTYS
jgi:hypothetical protein